MQIYNESIDVLFEIVSETSIRVPKFPRTLKRVKSVPSLLEKDKYLFEYYPPVRLLTIFRQISETGFSTNPFLVTFSVTNFLQRVKQVSHQKIYALHKFSHCFIKFMYLIEILLLM